ncbi:MULTISPECIES: ABC transporter permease [unclassified Modestobacter]
MVQVTTAVARARPWTGQRTNDRTWRRRSASLAGRLTPLAGPVVVLLGWELAARTVLAGSYALPAPTEILARFVRDLPFAWPNVQQTAFEAAMGWLWGNLVAVLAAAVFVLVRPVEAMLFRVFVALYCLPIVALAPILGAVLSEPLAQIVISAQGVFFTTLIAMMLGLRSASQTSLDLVTVSGGGGWRQLLLVRVHAALPSLFAGLRIAAPAAVLGAVVGEYLGARSGLGVAMVYSQQSLDVTRTWGLALSVTLLAAAFYLLTVLAERLLVPWATHGTALQALPAPAVRRGGPIRRTSAALGSAVLSVALVLVLWHLTVVLSGLSSYFMKTPVDVAAHLFTEADAAANRSQLGSSLLVTVRDTLLGYGAGTLAALGLATSIAVSRTARRVVLPFTIALRAVPLVALTPLFVLLFGRGVGVVLFIGGLVTCIPTLITVVTAMDRTPTAGRDLVTVNGGSRWQAVVRVMLPSALPAVFAAARVAAPTALLGALLAEWLATGEGLGSDMLRAAAGAQFGFVWSGVAAITLVAFLLYALATAAESASLRRLGG